MQDRPIRYINREEIDDRKWNDCIANSANCLIYGTTFYLDHLTERWDGLILNDYEAVMPLTWNKKCGMKYLFQPAFVQQSGVFCKFQPTAKTLTLFLDEAKQRFRFAEIALNFGNGAAELRERANYVLFLKGSYSEIYNAYKTDLKNNLRKAGHNSLKYQIGNDTADALILFESLYAEKMQVRAAQFIAFKRLCDYAANHGLLIIREVRHNEQLVASAILFNYRSRLYLLQDAISQEGRRLSANHFLIDQLIREFAGTDLVLDFEGSSIAGIAHFYQNFGAVNQPFYFFYHNRLPWPLNVYKRNKYFHAQSRAAQR